MDTTLPPDEPPGPDGNPGRRRGRPPKLTEQMLEAILTLLLQGNFRETVARAVGASPATFRRWMALGLDYPDGIYARLRAAVAMAEARAHVDAVGAIMAAGREDARHLCWWLERKFPQRWGKHRGELGELKRRVKEMEKLLEHELKERT